MDNWQQEFRHLASKMESAFDHGRLSLKREFKLLDKVTVLPYNAYGNEQKFFLHGRVLENEGLSIPEQDDSLWENLKTLYHRYESDEIPGAEIAYEFASLQDTLVSDEEGYFKTSIRHSESFSGWQKVKLRLQKGFKPGQEIPEVEGEVLFPSPENSFGVISDLDDTVIVSQATNFLEKSKILLLNNERTRKPFDGVSAFYQALQKGKEGQRNNPFFYASSASWNLYDMFKNFCAINQLPKGVFLLRDVGLDKTKVYRKGHIDHKLHKISGVLETFHHLPFLLIGDSGQKDPEIYQQLVEKYPDRIMGIYIRDVDPEKDNQRDKEVKAIAEKITQSGVPMLLVKDSLEAAQHARSQGWIQQKALEEIRQDVEKDQARKHDMRTTLGLHKLFG